MATVDHVRGRDEHHLKEQGRTAYEFFTHDGRASRQFVPGMEHPHHIASRSMGYILSTFSSDTAGDAMSAQNIDSQECFSGDPGESIAKRGDVDRDETFTRRLTIMVP